MKSFQMFLAAWMVFSFTISAVGDFLPRKARQALGVPGLILTLVVYAISVWVLIHCGAFSQL